MEKVWLLYESVWAEVISSNTYYSVVKYTLGGIEHQEMVENDAFLTMEEMGIRYERF
jgi:hypothetical protein